MKKTYKKPMIQMELFQLNENIAACATKVYFGPEDDIATCGDYGFGGDDPFARSAEALPFYKNSCVCYYTAPEGSGYFGVS